MCPGPPAGAATPERERAGEPRRAHAEPTRRQPGRVLAKRARRRVATVTAGSLLDRLIASFQPTAQRLPGQRKHTGKVGAGRARQRRPGAAIPVQEHRRGGPHVVLAAAGERLTGCVLSLNVGDHACPFHRNIVPSSPPAQTSSESAPKMERRRRSVPLATGCQPCSPPRRMVPCSPTAHTSRRLAQIAYSPASVPLGSTSHAWPSQCDVLHVYRGRRPVSRVLGSGTRQRT